MDKRFRITYRNDGPDEGDRFTQTLRAHDQEDAADLFYNSIDAEGWEIVKIVEVKP